MPVRRLVYRCGPFELDPAGGDLFHSQQRIPLSRSQSRILIHLIEHAGQAVSRDALIRAGWEGAHVNDNSLGQAMRRLRQALATGRKGVVFIETLPNHGYRFTARVERAERDVPAPAVDAEIAHHRAFVRGQTEIDSLDRERIQRAREIFGALVEDAPDDPDAHACLAMASGLAYEASVVDVTPDIAAQRGGIEHARRACQLDPVSAEAWSALAFVLHGNGESQDAVAAIRKAVRLEPGNWRHWQRCVYVGWGELRLHAARRVQAILPGFPMAHWGAATVFIGREAFPLAFHEVQLGCAAQDAPPRGTCFQAVGLHLLHGLLLAAHGRPDEAIAELERELASADCGQIFAKECAANTLYAIGAIRLRQQRRIEADAAFARALDIAPRHPSASAALRGVLPDGCKPIDAAVNRAIILARANRHAEAAKVYLEAVLKEPPGHAGWLLAVEPFLNPLAHGEIWAETRALIRLRAT